MANCNECHLEKATWSYSSPRPGFKETQIWLHFSLQKSGTGLMLCCKMSLKLDYLICFVLSECKIFRPWLFFSFYISTVHNASMLKQSSVVRMEVAWKIDTALCLVEDNCIYNVFFFPSDYLNAVLKEIVKVFDNPWVKYCFFCAPFTCLKGSTKQLLALVHAHASAS